MDLAKPVTWTAAGGERAQWARKFRRRNGKYTVGRRNLILPLFTITGGGVITRANEHD